MLNNLSFYHHPIPCPLQLSPLRPQPLHLFNTHWIPHPTRLTYGRLPMTCISINTTTLSVHEVVVTTGWCQLHRSCLFSQFHSMIATHHSVAQPPDTRASKKAQAAVVAKRPIFASRHRRRRMVGTRRGVNNKTNSTRRSWISWHWHGAIIVEYLTATPSWNRSSERCQTTNTDWLNNDSLRRLEQNSSSKFSKLSNNNNNNCWVIGSLLA